ncbi:hypothetical protein ADUPG1_014183, partial [Aduncisulcus paluster]
MIHEKLEEKRRKEGEGEEQYKEGMSKEGGDSQDTRVKGRDNRSLIRDLQLHPSVLTGATGEMDMIVEKTIKVAIHIISNMYIEGTQPSLLSTLRSCVSDLCKEICWVVSKDFDQTKLLRSLKSAISGRNIRESIPFT